MEFDDIEKAQEALKTAAKNLNTELGRWRNVGTGKGPPDSVRATINSNIEEIVKIAMDLQDQRLERSFGFASFFEEVGGSVIAAQRQLDTRTREGALKDPQFASAWRIPKVTAEMKFALESSSSNKFNILLFSSDAKQRRKQQHRVSFDVVAAPLPAEIQRQLAGGATGLPSVWITERESVRESLERLVRRARLPDVDSTSLKLAERLLTEQVFSRVLVLRSEEYWHLVLPGDGTIEHLRIRRDGKSPVLFGGKLSGRMRPPFVDLIRSLAADQTGAEAGG